MLVVLKQTIPWSVFCKCEETFRKNNTFPRMSIQTHARSEKPVMPYTLEISHKPKNQFRVQVVPETDITQVQTIATKENNEHENKRPKTCIRGFWDFVGAFGYQTLSINVEAQGSFKSILYALSTIMTVIASNAYRFLGPTPEMKYYLHFLPAEIITVIIFASLYTYMFHFEWILFMEGNGTHADGKPFQRFLVTFCVWYSTVTVMIILYVNDFMAYPGLTIVFGPYAVSLQIMLIFIWFEQPLFKRSSPEFRRRLRWFVTYPYAWFLGFPVIIGLGNLTTIIPMTYQPIMAFVIPFAKYVFSKFLNLVAEKASQDRNKSSTKFAVGLRIACHFGLYIVTNVGQHFSNMTICIMVFVEMILNLRLVRRIWKIHQRTTFSAQNELKGTLQILSIRETMEFLPAITYCILLFMLYLGPNKENFKASRGKTNDDLFEVIRKISYFAIFDAFRIGSSGVILWKTCKISLVSECCKLIERYWKVFGCMMALYTYWVSKISNSMYDERTWLIYVPDIDNCYD